MKTISFSRFKKLALFFITPLTYQNLKSWKIITIYAVIIAPAILITYSSISRYNGEYVHYDRMNKNIVSVFEKKKHKLSNSKAHYLDFVQITKEDDCLKHLSENKAKVIYSKNKTSNKKWLQCINKYTIDHRIINFISKKSALLDSFYSPAITFRNFSAITHKTIGDSVQYSSAALKKQAIYTILPIELKFSSSFKKALEYMQKLSDKCSNCQISIHKLNKAKTNNKFDIVLMVKLNLDIQDISDTKELSNQILAGRFSGQNLSNFSKEHP